MPGPLELEGLPPSRTPRILVILPQASNYYVDREVFRLVPSHEAVYATDSPEILSRFREPSEAVAIRFHGPPRALGNSAGALSRVHKICDLLSRIQPAVVVTFEVYSVTTDQVARLRKRFGYAHVVASYETTSPTRGLWGVFPVTRLLANRTASHADLFLAPSGKTRTCLLRVGAPPSRILPLRLGVFSSEFESARNMTKSSPRTILYLGALRRNKGLITLISGLDRIWSRDHMEDRLVIAGSGPLKGWLEEQAESRCWLRMEGPVSESRKVELMGGATLFVYPSEDVHLFGFDRWEEQGALSVIEAMVAGLPVLGTDSGALPELVPQGNRIVSQRSPDGLALAIRELLGDINSLNELGRRNSVYAGRVFDIQRNASRLGEAIDNLRRAV
ncbi:MAG TPA: glycosyltransferase family 4 protein [Thermoplasmata archaeon]|nr:glycosyltransferase family 4 protein [Thermoplasmata archaeon]